VRIPPRHRPAPFALSVLARAGASNLPLEVQPVPRLHHLQRPPPAPPAPAAAFRYPEPKPP